MPRPCSITERRKQVMHWVARGKSNKEIAVILGLSSTTVRKHIVRILALYGAPNRLCATMRAMARGDISAQELMREFA